MLSSRIPYSWREISDILRSIRNHNECPVKYIYFGIGAERFEKVLRHPKYESARVETELLRKKAINIVHRMKKPDNLNVIDLGCGDGSKALTLLKRFTELNQAVKYYAVDISGDMLNSAANTIERNLPKVEIEVENRDFEEGPLSEFCDQIRTRKYPINLLLFLGHSLGNVSNIDKMVVNIAASMNADDFCLIGVELFHTMRVQAIEAEYDFDEMFQLVFTPLEYLGVPRRVGHFSRPRFNYTRKEVEVAFAVHKPWVKEFRSNMCLELRPRQRIIMARSHKFTKKDLARLLAMHDLSILDSFADRESKFLLLFCQRGSR